jgi:indole-3-glycerol phosphate synthase
MKLEPAIVGINNRDLAAFTVDLKVTRDLARAIPQHVIVVSESGIASAADAAMLADAGVDAILVGEALMRSADPAKLLGELRCARPDKNLRHNAV